MSFHHKAGILMKTDKNLNFVGVIFIAAVLIICVIVGIAGSFKIENTKLSVDQPERFTLSWTKHESEPTNFSKSVITYSNTLPDLIGSSDAILVKTNHQRVAVYAGGKLIYTYGLSSQTPFGSVFGSVWNIIDIPNTYAGQSIDIICASTFNGDFININNTIIGDRNAIISNLVKNSIPTLFFCIITTIIGIAFCVASIVISSKRKLYNQKSFLYMGIFILLSSIWVFTDSNIPQLITENLAQRYMLSFFTFMLLPAPIIMYVRENCSHFKKFFLTLAYIDLGIFFMNVICYVFNIAEMSALLPITHIFIAISILSIISVSLYEKLVYRNESISGIILSICGLAVCGLVSIVMFLHSNSNIYYSIVFQAGMLTFISMLCFIIVKDYVRLINEHRKNEMYMSLAYTDIMTGISNRTFFEKEMTRLDKHWNEYFSAAIIVFDMNYLKFTNDTFGHFAGDELITGTANCIKKVFSGNGACFRIGGDEFAVILTNCSEGDIIKYLSQLDHVIALFNSPNTHPISVAYGYAVKDNDHLYNSAHELFIAADANMYTEKRRMKSL